MISSILVPTDGSETAQKAARYAIDLAKQLNSQITVMSVIDDRALMAQTISAPESPRHIIEPLEDYLKEAAAEYTKEIKEICDENDVPSKIIITTGNPAEEIVKEAERSKADLIIMGSQGRSALAAAFLGSVGYSVIHKETKIPVLIVKK